MPKRPSDSSGVFAEMSAERATRKTERSHEENQERAYIAASRRADRSIEARVQSAKMASEIHKKRTGKGFKISEEIVMKEEMYEEEDDDLPRQFRALAAHLRTSSPEMNNRLTAYLTNQVAMASMARQQEVNRLFAEQFPHASQLSQQLSQSMYYQPLQANQQPTSPLSPQVPPNYAQTPTSPTFSRDRSQSVAQASVMSPRQPVAPQQNRSPSSRHMSVDEQTSPLALTPGSVQTETPHSQPASMVTFAQSYPYQASASSNVPVDPSLTIQSPPSSSVFTSELPMETKMMANFDTSDPMYNVFVGALDNGELTGSEPSYYSYLQDARKASQISPMESDNLYAPSMSAVQVPTQNAFALFPGDESRTGTPGGGDGLNWDAWINNASDPDWADVNS